MHTHAETLQDPYKKIPKRNVADVEMAQCMNALADKVNKQEVPCTQ